MNIKYNEFGEVMSVNGLTTGQHIGKPMQDAAAEKPEDNEVYATERNQQTRVGNCVDDLQPSSSEAQDCMGYDMILETSAFQISSMTVDTLEVVEGSAEKCDKKMRAGKAPKVLLRIREFYAEEMAICMDVECGVEGFNMSNHVASLDVYGMVSCGFAYFFMIHFSKGILHSVNTYRLVYDQ